MWQWPQNVVCSTKLWDSLRPVRAFANAQKLREKLRRVNVESTQKHVLVASWVSKGSSKTCYKLVKGRVSTNIGNMELWARGWSIYFSELTVSFKPQENSSIRCILSTPEQNLLWHIIGCTPNTFHNTINKNVNHSNDTIDNLNQSSLHKPACQCQGHLRTESLSASAHILHCAKIRPWVVRSGFRCASADLRQSRYLHVAR